MPADHRVGLPYFACGCSDDRARSGDQELRPLLATGDSRGACFCGGLGRVSRTLRTPSGWRSRGGNFVRAFTLLGLCSAALIASVMLRRAWPLELVVFLVLGLALRSAYKARWKSQDPATLLLYGLHSHFQQVAIFVGQMQYRLHRLRGTRAGLVEYKDVNQAKR